MTRGMIGHAHAMCETNVKTCLMSPVSPDAVSGTCALSPASGAECLCSAMYLFRIVESAVILRGCMSQRPRNFVRVKVCVCVCACETGRNCLAARAKQACSRPWHPDQVFSFYLPQLHGLRAPMRLACYSTSFGQFLSLVDTLNFQWWCYDVAIIAVSIR